VPVVLSTWRALVAAVLLSLALGALLSDGAGSAPFGGLGNLSPLSPATVATPGSEPISLVVSPDGKSVYVGFEYGGAVSQFSRDTATGKITALSPATVAAGREPRTLAVSPNGKYIYAANFGSNNITTFLRNPETGKLTVHGSTVATGTDPHGIEVSSDGKSVYVANYGEATISQYSRNTETGALAALRPATVAAGSNPNGIAISVDRTSVYTANRTSNSVSQYSRNAESGKLTPLSSATVKAGANPHNVAISPDGRSVYVPDAGETTVSQYSRNTETGRLTALSPATVETAGSARGVAVSPDGASVYVANGTEGVVSQYSRNGETGKLTALSPATVAAGAHSYSVTVSPNGQSAYVMNEEGHNISQYSRARVPTVVTDAATAVTQTSAILNGLVTPGGLVSECEFEFGTSAAYGSTVTCTPSLGFGASPVPVSAAITGLAAGTVYHFRVSATNVDGTGAGSDRSFRTVAIQAASSPPAISAAKLTISAVRLTHRLFRVGKQPTAISASKKPLGTSFRFTLSAAAKLQIAITRSAPGLQHAHSCLAPTDKLKRAHAKRCTRTLTVATLTRANVPKGADSVPFSGRIDRRALSPRSYNAVLSASNAAGRSKPVTLSFTVVRR